MIMTIHFADSELPNPSLDPRSYSLRKVSAYLIDDLVLSSHLFVIISMLCRPWEGVDANGGVDGAATSLLPVVETFSERDALESRLT